jgi:hypothetical protein
VRQHSLLGKREPEGTAGETERADLPTTPTGLWRWTPAQRKTCHKKRCANHLCWQGRRPATPNDQPRDKMQRHSCHTCRSLANAHHNASHANRGVKAEISKRIL